MKIYLNKANELAIKQIMEDFKDEDDEEYSISQLANIYIEGFICKMFINGPDYYKKDYNPQYWNKGKTSN